jgi:hypothetical protein
VEPFREGQPVWVEQEDGSQRAAVYAGPADPMWFGGESSAYVVYPDTESGEQVSAIRVVPREPDETA